MKKIILLILCAVILLFSSCGYMIEVENETENVKAYIELDLCDGVTFVRVGTYGFTNVYVHKETRVIYIYDKGFTVLLDENGKPMLWEGEL